MRWLLILGACIPAINLTLLIALWYTFHQSLFAFGGRRELISRLERLEVALKNQEIALTQCQLVRGFGCTARTEDELNG